LTRVVEAFLRGDVTVLFVVVLANWVITLDPVFSGLAWAIIFGIITSTLFTLIVIPTVYWLLYGTSGEAQ
jgi:multidrug efflux pump subunit AcrB